MARIRNSDQGFYWSDATNHYNVIKQHALLHNGTYSTAIEAGEKIAAGWGTFAFYWNFAVWIPTLWFPPPLNLPFMVIDTTIAIYLSMATHHQTGYSPHNMGACNPNNPNFYNLQRPPGTNESFFQAAARLNATITTPKAMCEDFVEEWQYGVALSFFYTFIALLNIIGFFGALQSAKNQGKNLREVVLGLGQGLFALVNSVPKGLLVLLAAILYFLPESLFRCLPLSVKAPIRTGRRHALKAGLGLEQTTEMKMSELKTEIKNRNDTKGIYKGAQGEKTPLAEFLGIYDMLVLVTQELHYLDMKNLSRVSKSVHESVLPAQDFERRLKVFKLYTCNPAVKYSCWTCSNQICVDCAQHPLIPQTTLLHHLDNCQPYCTPCYNTHIVRRRPVHGQRLTDPYCRCAPVRAKPNLFFRYLNGSNYYTTRQASLPKLARAVCRECNLHTDAELLALREKKTKSELKQGLQKTGAKWTTCARPGCGRDLGTGPRWWICKNNSCGKECTSWVHGAWGKAGKSGDGTAVGGEAV